MDSFDIKFEKVNAMFRYRRLQRITTLFRFMEFFVFLFLISKLSSQLPNFPVAEYFRRLSVAVFSPRFVFIIGNAIIVVLFFKSGQLSLRGNSNKIDFYEEYVQHCKKRAIATASMNAAVSEIPREETKTRSPPPPPPMPPPIVTAIRNDEKRICRSQSEMSMIGKRREEDHRRLRRSVTEVSNKRNLDPAEVTAACAEDELSSEEFRRTVEAFIARQQKSLRDEEFCPMVYIGT